ncbi:hypothetical protein NE237_001840 [Protea cynaroides]|uniref:Uncharacterized protein n=1 Tax=Protea cynaroides TaxID=273540 RepID=A0A9Q0KUW3_9MAGN|nr:hypothetical protein NE237_001840 [Protea cynaroides]
MNERNPITTILPAVNEGSFHDRRPNPMVISDAVGVVNLQSRISVDRQSDSALVAVGIQGETGISGIVSQNPNNSSSDPMLMEAEIRKEPLAIAVHHQGALGAAAHYGNGKRRATHKRQRLTWREKGKSIASNVVGASEGHATNVAAATRDGIGASDSVRVHEASVNVNRAVAARSFTDVARGFQEASVEGIAEPTSVAGIPKEDHGQEAANVGVEKVVPNVQLQQAAYVEADGSVALPVLGSNPNDLVGLAGKQVWADVSDGDDSGSLEEDGADSAHENQIKGLQSHATTPPGSDSENVSTDLTSTMHGSGSEW